MIFYKSQDKATHIDVVFDGPQEAVDEISDMIVNTITLTCEQYLHNNRQKELAELISKEVLKKYNMDK